MTPYAFLRAVLAVGAASAAAAGPFGTRVDRAPHPAVCRVTVQERDGEAWGSGTLIDTRDQYGLVVTNWHVVRDAAGKIEVRFPCGAVSEARPLKLDETWDLAALVVWRPPTEPAPLADHAPQPGDTLTICGYGSGDYLSQTGRCTDYYSPEVGQPQELVELDVQARQGDSGGPIFNDRGELAGVLFGASRGTTLGSFGGRVRTFLATLAPDIGVPPTAVAAAAPPRVEPVAADPFQAAERVAATPVRPPPSLADRSSAPVRAARRHGADVWRSAALEAPSAAIAGARDDSEAATGFSPQVSMPPPEQSAQAVDWASDGRNLLALVGIAALVVAGMRSLS